MSAVDVLRLGDRNPRKVSQRPVLASAAVFILVLILSAKPIVRQVISSIVSNTSGFH